MKEYDVIVITETWLSDDINSSEFFDNCYNVYRCDRIFLPTASKKGGGVLIAVKADFSSRIIALNCFGTIEQLCVEVSFSCDFKRSIFFIVSYIPPNSSNDIYQNHLDNIDYIQSLTSNAQEVFVLGDFNLKDITWLLEDNILLPFNKKSDNDENVTSFFLAHCLNQINNFKNDIGRILDLIFISNDLRTSCNLCLNPISRNTVHHKAIVITFEFYIFEKEPHFPTKSYNFVIGDYAAINNYFATVDWSLIFSYIEPTQIHQFLIDKIDYAVSLNVPFVEHSLEHKPPWFNKRLSNLKNVKNKAYKRYKVSNEDADLKYFQQIRREFDFLQNFLYNNYIFIIESRISSDSSAFWQFINVRRNHTVYPTTMIYDNNSSNNIHETCNLFASYFQTIFTSHNNIDVQSFQPILGNLKIEISEEDVTSSILELKDNPSCIFPDSVPSLFFKKCVQYLARPITILFNACLKEGTFIDSWKHCCVVPIFKSGDKTNVLNYRPIVKQCALSKIFDKILKIKLFDHVSSSISQFQHGFFPGRSTCTNLAVLSNKIIASMENKNQIDVIYTDFAKAFDSVSHDVLLYKLLQFGVNGKLLEFFKSFLINRTLLVKMGSCYSTLPIRAISGIPQGTHLGPLLFLIFINDLPDCLQFCKPLLFADDLKLFANVSNLHHSMLIQKDLSALSEWCNTNRLSFNVDKCCNISYTHSRDPVIFDYSIGDVFLKRVVEVKDLGVIFDSKLEFKSHINYITSKAYAMLGFIKRNTKEFKDYVALKSLFVSFVRNNLEYCSIIWNPYYEIHSNRIERIQKLFCKFALKKINYNCDGLSYESKRKLLGLQSLKDRRSYFSIFFIYNILNNEINCIELSDLINLYSPTRDLRLGRLFYENFHRTNYGNNEPITRCLKLCNSFSPFLNFHLQKHYFKLSLFNIFN